MELDWNQCVICQQDKPEPLKCPMQGPTNSCVKIDVYSSFLANLKEFRDLDALPTSICFGDNVSAADLLTHRASWHKSCHLKYNNSKLTKARKRKAKHIMDNPEQRPPNKRQAIEVDCCVFCMEGHEEGDLHQVSTFDADSNIRTMITVLQETELLGRIDGGDLIAKETKYHLKCLTSLRNRYRSHIRKLNQDEEKAHADEENMNMSRVFVELVSFIEKTVGSGTSLFKLSDIHSLYMNRLKDFGISKGFNKTRLKERLLEHFPETDEQFDGRNTIITFNKAVQSILREAMKKRDFSEDAITLAKAATIIRTDIFNHSSFKFTGSFPPHCQENSLPSSLKLLTSLIFNGPNLKDQDQCESQECLTVGQAIVYNTKKRGSASCTAKTRHSPDHEPPLPIYIGLNLHQVTRSKKLTRTRHAHQVTLLTLQKLQREAFLKIGSNLSEEAWRSDMLKKSPTFMFWDLILRYETLILIFVRAHREKNFPLYVHVLEELTSLFFALDHVNYSRWIPVHIRDMKHLPMSIKDEFDQECHWVISKTNKKFSSIPIDQAHEQENAFVKGSGGCI